MDQNQNNWRKQLGVRDFFDFFDKRRNKWISAEIKQILSNGDIEYITMDLRRPGTLKVSDIPQIELGFSKSTLNNAPPPKEPEPVVPDWIGKLTKGALIDAKDKIGRWRLAEYHSKVKDQSKYLYLVQFHDDHLNEWVGQSNLALALTKSASQAPKKPEWNVRMLQKDNFLDVLDQEGVWLEAMIVKIDNKNDRVYIHFIGYEKKWDEWISRRETDRFAKIQTKIPVSARKLPNKPIYSYERSFTRIATRGLHQKQITELSQLVSQCCRFDEEVKKFNKRNLQRNPAAAEALMSRLQNLDTSLQQAKTSGFQDDNHELTFKMCQNLVNSLKKNFESYVEDDTNVSISGRKQDHLKVGQREN